MPRTVREVTMAIALGVAAVGCRYGFADRVGGDAGDAGAVPPARIVLIACGGTPVGSVRAFQFAPQTRALTPIADQPVGDSPDVLLLSPDHQVLYVGNLLSSSISTLGVDATGALRLISTVPYGTARQPKAMAISPTSGRLVVGSRNPLEPELTEFARDPVTGQLGAPLDLTLGGNAKVRGLAVAPSKSRIYTANWSSYTTTMFATQSGALAGRVDVATVDGPVGATVSPSERYLYVTGSERGEVALHYLALDGQPSAPTIFAGPDKPVNIVVSPDEKSLYTVNYDQSNVSSYRLDPATGHLVRLSDHPVGQQPGFLALDATGEFLFSTAYGTADLVVFQRDPASGELTEVLRLGVCPANASALQLITQLAT